MHIGILHILLLPITSFFPIFLSCKCFLLLWNCCASLWHCPHFVFMVFLFLLHGLLSIRSAYCAVHVSEYPHRYFAWKFFLLLSFFLFLIVTVKTTCIRFVVLLHTFSSTSSFTLILIEIGVFFFSRWQVLFDCFVCSLARSFFPSLTCSLARSFVRLMNSNKSKSLSETNCKIGMKRIVCCRNQKIMPTLDEEKFFVC